MIARRPRGFLVALAVVVLLFSTVASSWAARKSCGPGCPNNPDDLINNAESGDVITPLYEQDFGRNTNAAVLKVDAEIEGGWSHPGFNCGGSATGSFPDRDAMLAAGFSYDTNNRSELRGFGARVVGLDSAVKNFQIRDMILAQFGSFTGNGGVLGQSAAGLTGTSVTLANTTVRADPSGSVALTGNGGGLYLELDAGSTLRITGSSFTKNTATNGGAIQVRLRGNSTLFIAESAFQDNDATVNGGAIRVLLESGSVVIADTQFSGNTAIGAGRDIRIEGPTGASASQRVYLVRNTYSGANSVSVTGNITVYTNQVALPLVRR